MGGGDLLCFSLEQEKQDFDVCIKRKSVYNRPSVKSSGFYFHLEHLENGYNEPAYLTS